MEQQEICSGAESKCCHTCGCASACAVTPFLSDEIERFLSKPEFLLSLTEQNGSPLNIIFPEAVVTNRRNFQDEINKRGINGAVLFTSKPNKSRGVLASIARDQGGIDVSSAGAFKEALNAGIRGSAIQASGPKNDEYLYLALMHQAAISVDSLSELKRIVEIVDSNGNIPIAQTLTRISGFRSDRMKFMPTDSPFGISIQEYDKALRILSENSKRINFRGIHFHFLGGGKDERLVAFENSIECIKQGIRAGLNPRVVNIGGGFKIRYAKSKEEWFRFQSYLRDSLLGNTKPITWEGSGLGLRVESGRISGVPVYDDHYPLEHGAGEFGSFLDNVAPDLDQCTVSQVIRDLMLELQVEPGKALLDQAGVTIAEVSSVKESAGGQMVVMLQMNNTNIRSKERKLLTQPIAIKRGPRTATSKGFYLFGSLCIARDLIQPQKIYPGFEPQRGDLVAFVNTAPYLMDFVESEVLLHPIPKKVAVFSVSGGFKAISDDLCSVGRIVQTVENR